MDRPDQHDPTRMGSERSFGLVFAGFFAVVTGVRWYRHGTFTTGTAVAAAVFLLIAFAAPRVLRPLNIVWFRFGLLLNRITSPIVMGGIFFLAVLPTGLLLRVFGKRPMRLKFRDPAVGSYWLKREPPGPRGDMMINQF